MKIKNRLVTLGIIIITMILLYMFGAQILMKLYLKMTGNYKTPGYETQQSILGEVRAKHLNYDRLYYITDYRALLDFQQKKLTSFPFVQIYDSQKHMISLASGEKCKWMLMNIFSEKDTTSLIKGDSLSYNFILDRITPLDIKSNVDTFDYYIIAGWAKYIPKLSDSLFAQTNRMRNSLSEKICFSYINFDFQEAWKSTMDSLDQVSNK